MKNDTIGVKLAGPSRGMMLVLYFSLGFAVASIAYAIVGCTPAASPIDAGDASYVIVAPEGGYLADGAPTLCETACLALVAVGCNVGADALCYASMAMSDADKTRRNPTTGLPRTCADVAAVRTRADVAAVGIYCP